MPELIAKANARRSAVRSLVEHAFAGQKHCMGPFIRTAAANAASVTQLDARDVLSAIGRRRDLVGPIPVCGTMWVQQRWREGHNHRKIAHELRVSTTSVARRKQNHGFAADRHLD